ASPSSSPAVTGQLPVALSHPHERFLLMAVLHVSPTGSDSADAAEDTPLRTISRAAELAVPGDTVRGRAGEDRGWGLPVRGGLADQRRIVYEAAPGEQVVIKGRSEERR